MVAAAELVRQAKAAGLDLTGPDGLFEQFTKTVLETALNEEMKEHLGQETHTKSAEGPVENLRKWTTSETVLTDSAGAVEIEVSRGRRGTFEPVKLKKRQRGLKGVGSVPRLFAKGTVGGVGIVGVSHPLAGRM